ncbi:hypothetical protein LJ707_01990 [Mucilaginibacter sp. UR6-1]|uniref:hypothetical protein n=1 Tax=Mucilaginibacter sp. UR6-1 TaxID=1435643 RepID=UPI001E5E30DB|nr:hypothetical protein [Mucilaginibacter sp. UR6-1]MCC8407681.1 hypothetical protein [Mucilaginibacter sp. UR6-1]
MNGPFLIRVVFAGSEQEYNARFERWGYTHRISVLIGETTIVFEPDEEGSYRAIASENLAPERLVPFSLLELIAEKLKILSE